MTLAASPSEPVELRSRLTLRHRLGYGAVALLLAFLFVVGPAQQARAVWPVVAWGVAALARSAIPGIAARTGVTTVLSTPLRSFAITSGGIATNRIGQMALNVGALGLGLALWPLAANNGEPDPWVELGAEQDDLDAIEDYVGANATGPLPHYQSSYNCWHELTSVSWAWSGGQTTGFPIATAVRSSGPNRTGLGAPGASTCGGYAPPVYAAFRNIATGELRYVGGYSNTSTSGTGIYTQSTVMSGNHTTYNRNSGWWFEGVRFHVVTSGQYSAAVDITVPNRFAPNGSEVNGTLPDGYYGVRECVPDGGGAAIQVRQQAQAGIPIPGPCPVGYYSTGYGVWQGDPAAGGVELFAVGSTENWNLNADGTRDYQNCVAPDGHTSNGRCELSVSVDGRTCAYGVVGCAGWMEVVNTNPERVTCYWGAYTMPPSDCAQLQYAYSTPYGVQIPQMIGGSGPNWIPAVGPDGQPLPGVTPGTVPLPITDPGGTPWPSPEYNPPPTTDPPGAGSLPLTGTNPQLANNTAPQWDMGACLGAMWQWNPIAWVHVPVRCALEWAFTPRPEAIQDAQNAVVTGYRASAFAPITGAIENMGGTFQSIYGCEGLPFDVNFFGIEFRGRLFESCSPPWDGVASFTRNIITGVLWLGGGLAIMRYGAGVFGFMGVGGAGPDTDRVRFK